MQRGSSQNCERRALSGRNKILADRLVPLRDDTELVILRNLRK